MIFQDREESDGVDDILDDGLFEIVEFGFGFGDGFVFEIIDKGDGVDEFVSDFMSNSVNFLVCGMSGIFHEINERLSNEIDEGHG